METSHNSLENKESVRIAVYSDVICPWCYIGKHRLERGLAQAGKSAQIVWLPYELNPDMPAEGVDRTAYLDAKFGPGKRAQIEAHLSAAAAQDGLTFDWSRVTRTPNTRKAHILIALATGLGHGDAVKGALMRAFFKEGRDIGDDGVLAEIGETFGLTRPELTAAFVDPTLHREIDRLETQAHQIGVQGVPFFIINESHALSGAQPAAVWDQVVRKLTEDGASAG